MELEPGSQYGPYILTERLRPAGAMRVFRCTKSDDSGGGAKDGVYRAYVFVETDDSNVDTDKLLEQMARVGSSLHPALVTPVDWGRVGNTVYAATEEVSGWSLEDMLAACANRGVKPEAAAEIMSEVAGALSAIHSLGVLPNGEVPAHRHLSPAEIWITREGQPRVTGAELPLAFQATGGRPSSAMRAKLAYMAPEQVEGGEIDGRSDLFTCGVILHELLTGKRLFQRESKSKTILAVRRHPAPSPSTLSPWVDESLDQLVLGALEKKPDRRPLTASRWAEHLKEYRRRFHPTFDRMALRQAPSGLVAGSDTKPETPDPSEGRSALKAAAVEATDGMTALAEAHPDLESEETRTAAAVERRDETVEPAPEPTQDVGHAADEIPARGSISAKVWRSWLVEAALACALLALLVLLGLFFSRAWVMGERPASNGERTDRGTRARPKEKPSKGRRPRRPAATRPVLALGPDRLELRLSGLEWRIGRYWLSSAPEERSLLNVQLRVTNQTSEPVSISPGRTRLLLSGKEPRQPILFAGPRKTSQKIAPSSTLSFRVTFVLTGEPLGAGWRLALP
jgi:serine/threonine protein kinase